MATPAQQTANRQNARKSTGPKTAVGKARTAQNAIRHGVYTMLPVIPAFERRSDWDAHCEGIVQSLMPLGTLEETLAVRIALCTWRLARLQRYETALTIAGVEDAETRLQPTVSMPLSAWDPADAVVGATLQALRDPTQAPEVALPHAVKRLQAAQAALEDWAGPWELLHTLTGLPEYTSVAGAAVYGVWQACLDVWDGEDDPPDIDDTRLLRRMGVPEAYLDDPEAWEGWTAGVAWQGLTVLAAASGMEPTVLLAKALRAQQPAHEQQQVEVQRYTALVHGLQQRVTEKVARLQQERLVLRTDVLQNVMRYETHLSRQLFQTLHELQRLQAARHGQVVPPPALVDVVVTTTADEPPCG